MDKWDYINRIRREDDKYGGLLLKMMEKYNKNNLYEITEVEVKEFYEELRERGFDKNSILGF